MSGVYEITDCVSSFRVMYMSHVYQVTQGSSSVLCKAWMHGGYHLHHSTSSSSLYFVTQIMICFLVMRSFTCLFTFLPRFCSYKNLSKLVMCNLKAKMRHASIRLSVVTY